MKESALLRTSMSFSSLHVLFVFCCRFACYIELSSFLRMVEEICLGE